MDRSQSALIVPVELPPKLQGWRDRLDPTAAVGVPAHVTLLYPFMPPQQVSAAVLAQVVSIASYFAAFPFALDRIQRWPDVVCLLPEPAEPFRRLIVALAVAFPDYPPYGGAHGLDDIVPHVTIAHTRRADDLDALEQLLPAHLPVNGRCLEVSLITHHPGVDWKAVWSYRLPTESAG